VYWGGSADLALDGSAGTAKFKEDRMTTQIAKAFCLLSFGLACVFSTATPASAELYCHHSDTATGVFNVEGRINAVDVYSDSSESEPPMLCAVCIRGTTTTGSVYTTWAMSGGGTGCASGDTTIYTGIARTVPGTTGAVAVPALSLLGTAVLVGGILTGLLLRNVKRVATKVKA
jgi:hypothetical protein